jgi:hypothetical protein
MASAVPGGLTIFMPGSVLTGGMIVLRATGGATDLLSGEGSGCAGLFGLGEVTSGARVEAWAIAEAKTSNASGIARASTHPAERLATHWAASWEQGRRRATFDA